MVEFKLKLNYPDKIANEIVALANAKGGWLLLGVSDDGQIKGLKNPEEDEYEFDKLCRELIKFPVEYQKYFVKVDDKRKVLAIRVAELLQKPTYSLENKFQKMGTAYIRVGDKSVQASKLVCRILKLQSQNKGMAISLGQDEQQILKYIGTQVKVNKTQIKNDLCFNENHLDNILVNLVVGGLLEIHPDEEKDDIFNIKQ
jgi:predicted HTH transcriptional regulator